MNTQTVTLVAASLAFCASIVAASVTLYNARFAKFTREKWWERKAEAYASIVEALAGMVSYHEEHLAAYEEGRNIPSALKDETDEQWKRGYAELKRASAVGAFMISPDAESALRKMWKDKGIESQNWFDQLENDYVVARDCLRTVVESAKRDLAGERHTARRQTVLRRSAVAIAIALVVGLGVWAALELRSARRWPFSTGTRDAAFLGATFGMSPQEVRRTIAGFGAPLLTVDEYKRLEPEPNAFPIGSFALFYDDRNDANLYMPGIEMFDSKVDAEFNFSEERLRSLSVYFAPISSGNAEAVVSALDASLQTTYKLAGRENSTDVLGAYTLRYTTAGASPTLWVNLTDREKPIIVLSVVPSTFASEHQEKIQHRQRNAFRRQ